MCLIFPHTLPRQYFSHLRLFSHLYLRYKSYHFSSNPQCQLPLTISFSHFPGSCPQRLMFTTNSLVSLPSSPSSYLSPTSHPNPHPHLIQLPFSPIHSLPQPATHHNGAQKKGPMSLQSLQWPRNPKGETQKAAKVICHDIA